MKPHSGRSLQLKIIIKTILHRIIEFIAVVLTSMIIAGFIGWLQSIVAFRSRVVEGFGLVAGIWTSMLLSPVLYYVILKRKIKMKQFLFLVILCFSSGIITAFIMGPYSLLVTVTVLIIGTFYIRSLNELA